MIALSRKERDRKLRRADILKAAEHLFALKGYHKATIRDIAKEAQYATGTVYLHFKDKGDLYLALLEGRIKDLLGLFKEGVSSLQSPRQKIEAFVREGLEFFEKNRDFFQIIASEDVESLSEKRFSVSPVGRQIKDYVVSLVKESQKSGFIDKKYDPFQAGEILISMLKTVSMEWLQKEKNKKMNLEQQQNMILGIFFNGVAAK